DDREVPPERLTVEELNRRAHESTDRVPIGTRTAGAARLTTSSLTWSALGPTPITGDYWSNYNNAAGRVAAIIVHPTTPSNANLILVAGDLGVIRTTDGGTSWSAVLSGGPSNWCNDLVMDPSSSAVLYASIYGVGIYKSANGGNSWTLLAGGLPTTGFQRIN